MRHATSLLYHVCTATSCNVRFASCGTSGKLTLWTCYIYHLCWWQQNMSILANYVSNLLKYYFTLFTDSNYLKIEDTLYTSASSSSSVQTSVSDLFGTVCSEKITIFLGCYAMWSGKILLKSKPSTWTNKQWTWLILQTWRWGQYVSLNCW
jgi:hypothetical protein